VASLILNVFFQFLTVALVIVSLPRHFVVIVAHNMHFNVGNLINI